MDTRTRTHILFGTPCRWLVVRLAQASGRWVPFVGVDRVIDEPPPPLQTQQVVERWSGRRTYTLISYRPHPHYSDVVIGVWEPDIPNPHPLECLYLEYCTASAKERTGAARQWRRIEGLLECCWNALNEGDWAGFRRHLRALRRVFKGSVYWVGLDTRIAHEYRCVARRKDSLAYATPVGYWWITRDGGEFHISIGARTRRATRGRPSSR